VTRRGFKEEEVAQLANWICDILDDISNDDTIARVKGQVQEICARFPVYK
jgi:glycine hydroxymethyltransferase